MNFLKIFYLREMFFFTILSQKRYFFTISPEKNVVFFYYCTSEFFFYYFYLRNVFFLLFYLRKMFFFFYYLISEFFFTISPQKNVFFLLIYFFCQWILMIFITWLRKSSRIVFNTCVCCAHVGRWHPAFPNFPSADSQSRVMAWHQSGAQEGCVCVCMWTAFDLALTVNSTTSTC